MIRSSCSQQIKASRYVVGVMLVFGLVGQLSLRAHEGHGHEQSLYKKHAHEREILIVSSRGYCPWCDKLKGEIPALKQLAGSQAAIRVRDDYEKVSQQYGVSIGGFPTTFLIVDGKVVERFTGFYHAHKLWDMVIKALNKL